METNWKDRHTAAVAVTCYILYKWVMFGITHDLFSRNGIRNISPEFAIEALMWLFITFILIAIIALLAICIGFLALQMLFSKEWADKREKYFWKTIDKWFS